jgi:hypothetical protein
MDESYIPQAKHMVQKFKLLYTNGLMEQWETLFRTDFENTWIEGVVRSLDGEGVAGLKSRVDDENLDHEIKRPVIKMQKA